MANPSVKGTANANAGNTVTIPTHAVGDVIIIFAFRDGSTTQPSKPAASGTVPAWSDILSGNGANTCSERSAYFVATATNHTSGTWTNATGMIAVVIQNPKSGTFIGGTAKVGGTSSTIARAPAITQQQTTGKSLILEFYGHRTVTAWSAAPSGYTRQASVSTEVALNTKDSSTTDGQIDQGVTTSGSSGYRGQTIEILGTETSPTTALNTPANSASISDSTPTLNFTGTDGEADNVEYEVQIDDASFPTATNALDIDVTNGTKGLKLLNYAAIDAMTDGQGTLELWMYESSASGLAYAPIIETTPTNSPQAATTPAGLETENALPSDGVNFKYEYDGGTNADGYAPTGAGVSGFDTWRHIAIVWTPGSPTKIYKDGVEISYNLQQTPVGSPQVWDGTDFYFLVYTDLSGSLKGRVGGFIRLWNTVRTTTEINNNKAKHLNTADVTGLIANLKFTEGSGTTVANESDGSHNAVTVGTPTWVVGPDIAPAGLNVDALSSADAGFTAGHPFTSGAAKDYTVQSALSDGTYYWRVRAIDPTGSNAWGVWATSRSFTLSSTTNVTANASIVTATSSVIAPVVTGKRNVSTTAVLVSTTSSIIAPAVKIGARFTDTVHTTTSSVIAPTITANRSVTINPTVLTATASVVAPSESTTRYVTINTSVLSSTASVIAPTVTGKRNVSFSATIQSVTASLNAPTITARINITANATLQTVTSSIFAPTVTGTTGGIDVEVDPTILSTTSSVGTPVVTARINVSASATLVSVTSSINAPTVNVTRNVNIPVTIVTATASVIDPSEETHRSVTITGQIVQADSSVIAPSVTTKRSVTVDMTLLGSTCAIITPSILAQVVGRPSALSLTSSVFAPSITTYRSVTVHPHCVSTGGGQRLIWLDGRLGYLLTANQYTEV